MLIVYDNGRELIITTPQNEPRTIQEVFDEGCRDINNYDREVIEDCSLLISPRLRVRPV